MKLKLTPLLFGSLLVSIMQVNAEDASVENLTVASSAFFGGLTSFGYADGGAPGEGFTIDVFSGISNVQREEVIPGHTAMETNWEDVWGWIDGPQETVWTEEYGPISTEVWVDDYGPTTESVWVEEYGQVPYETWVPDEYDENGNVTVPGHYVTEYSEGVVGGHYEDQEGWGIIGGHYETQTGWGLIGGHYETVPGEPVWGVVDTVQTVSEIWVPEQVNSYTETIHGVPVVRQIGKTADTVWKWKNLDKELLEVSQAGLSIPKTGDTTGQHRAVLTATMLEQSYTSPAGSDTYLSYGVKLQKDGVEAWADTGTNDVVQKSDSLSMKPAEVVLREEIPVAGTTSVETRTTRLAVNSSRFGGLVEVAGDVKVQGAIRVQPRGDLSMGSFTQGPQP